MLDMFQDLGDTFWQPDLRMCLFADGFDPAPEKPFEYISLDMHPVSLPFGISPRGTAMPQHSPIERAA